jgi:hypothetical protein
MGELVQFRLTRADPQLTKVIEAAHEHLLGACQHESRVLTTANLGDLV